jgi:NAD-dependent DNA ligase
LKGSATNRQKKVLKFFEINYHPSISKGAAGWEIGNILSVPENAERWHKYLFLTRDFDAESDELLSYDSEQLESVVLPEDFHAGLEIKSFQEEIAAQILASESPFDNPQPNIEFTGSTFCFTGKFDLGSRKACEQLISKEGGIPVKGISGELDYLVIGSQGSSNWKREKYGSKIEKAVLLRRQNGNPAIVSECHCFSNL